MKREMLVCLIATILLMPFALMGTDNYVYVTEEAVCEQPYFSWEDEVYRYDENTVLQIEKRYNDAHSLSSLRCYMKNEKKRFNILNNDLGMDMVRFILEESPIRDAKLEGDLPVSKQEAEQLMANSHDNLNKVVYRWFLYEYMGVEK